MPHHVVVDGSNLATEGRERPSLQQLNDAVLSYMQEDPDALVTVVVDATFGHRIDPKEVAEFDEAINNNELVAPPAGAIGRGDAFVLSIANKVNAVILTNDSYQEFHAEYPWLFDEGRLVGGKPVPHIGWVFVKRLPVRGPISRKVTAQAKKPGRVAVSAAANQPMPVPSVPPPGRAVPSKRQGPAKPPSKSPADQEAPVAATVPPSAPAAQQSKVVEVNDLVSFLTFVEHHPVGSSVSATVHHYSSHGAYVQVADVMGYVPLRLMADPQPRSAREFMKLGDTVELVVQGFVAEKRSIDLATPAMSTVPAAAEPVPKPTKARRSTKKAGPAETPAPAADSTPVDTPVDTGVATTDAASPEQTPAKKTAAKKAPAKKAPAKKAAATPSAEPEVAEEQPTVSAKPATKSTAAKAAAKKTAKEKASTEPAAPLATAEPEAPAPSAKKGLSKKAPAKKAPTKKVAGASAESVQPAQSAEPASPAEASAPVRRRGRSGS